MRELIGRLEVVDDDAASALRVIAHVAAWSKSGHPGRRWSGRLPPSPGARPRGTTATPG